MEHSESISSLQAELTRLKAENDTIRKQTEHSRHFFEHLPVMIFLTDDQGMFTQVNQAGASLMGCQTPDEVIGTHLGDCFFFNSRSESQHFAKTIQTQGSIKQFQTTLRKKDGRLLIVSLTGTRRPSETGEFGGYEGIAMDITGRVASEKSIKDSEKKYKAILDNSLSGIYMFQEGGRFSYVNKRFLKILGYDHPKEIIGRRFWELIALEDRAIVKKRGLEREKHEIQSKHYSYRMIRKDGSIIWVDMRSSHAAYMGIPAVVGNFIDISREKEAQNEIQSLSHKLIEGIEDERRSIASDLHDEFGQSLTLLQFDIERLQQMLPPEHTASIFVSEKIMEQIQALADKIRNTTSRLRPDLLDHLGLVPTLEWYIEDFNERFQDIRVKFQSIGFKRRLDSSTEIVIYRIFQEGLNNVTKHAKASEVMIQLTASHPKVIFIMKDNGTGFIQTEDGMPKDGQSLGIGLLSMKERATSLGGEIEIRSAPGKGVAIRVELPMG